jgi:hypothetical protein
MIGWFYGPALLHWNWWQYRSAFGLSYQFGGVYMLSARVISKKTTTITMAVLKSFCICLFFKLVVNDKKG